MLAGELALAAVDVVVVERRTSQDLDGSRAGGLHSRTIEVLDQRGIAERFLSAGQQHPNVGYAQIPLNISDFPTRHNYVLALWQSHFERILADWVDELGVPVLRGCEVTGFTQNDSGVDVDVSGHAPLRAAYLAGCDGGRSVVRKAAGIDFVGLDPTTSWMIAEVEMDEEPEFGFRRDSAGTHAIGRREDGEPIRVVITERHLDHTDDPSMDELREALVAVYGTDFGLRRANWISRFTDMARQAASYRHGRILLAGDAAHVTPPFVGQGFSAGARDAGDCRSADRKATPMPSAISETSRGAVSSGIGVADFNLFREKKCILTLSLKTQPTAIAKVKNLWEIVGARVFTMDPETHDWVFGIVSHLPHVVAYALVNSVASVKEPANIFDFAGGGLRDYTRIGASSPEMWSDIFLKNRENVLKAIGEFKKSLDKIQSLIEQENLKGLKEELKKSVRVKDSIDKVNE